MDAAFGELEPLVGTKGACQQWVVPAPANTATLRGPGSVHPSRVRARPMH